MVLAAKPLKIVGNWELTAWGAALIAVLFVGVWGVIRIRSWFRDREDSDAGAHEMLIQLRDLHREGGLTDDEFRSIKGQLVEQIDLPKNRLPNNLPDEWDDD